MLPAYGAGQIWAYSLRNVGSAASAHPHLQVLGVRSTAAAQHNTEAETLCVS